MGIFKCKSIKQFLPYSGDIFLKISHAKPLCKSANSLDRPIFTLHFMALYQSILTYVQITPKSNVKLTEIFVKLSPHTYTFWLH